jgi:hypothetical protein
LDFISKIKLKATDCEHLQIIYLPKWADKMTK